MASGTMQPGTLHPGTLQPGSLFAGRYEILRCIGQGGMGAVYEAVHRETQRRRALKVLLPMLVSDQEARARFAQEASITAEIESEHLVEIFDAGVDAGTGCPFIVMELLRGETLGERLARKQRTDPGDVVEIGQTRLLPSVDQFNMGAGASMVQAAWAGGRPRRDQEAGRMFWFMRNRLSGS